MVERMEGMMVCGSDGMLPPVGVGLGDRNTLAGLAVEYRGVGVCGVEGIGVPAPRSVRLVLDRGCQRLR
jgi:hypothetical protein